MPTTIGFSVFTKPWRMPISELAAFVKRLGFDGIELPVRPGYQVEPERIDRELPAAARRLAGDGLRIASIAPPMGGPVDERMIAACAAAGVPLVRIVVGIPEGQGYLESEARARRELEAAVPLLDQYGVAIGIQNHSGRWVPNALGVRRLVEPFERRHVRAVWDPAHCALEGEMPELAADILWSHLGMVNLKNGSWRRVDGPEDEAARFERHWTSGRQGLCHWPTVAAELRRRHYSGVICLTSEYSDEGAVDHLIAEDFAFARSLFA